MTERSEHDRPIVATWHRKNQAIGRRHYARLDTAIRRITQLAVLEGEPRDVVEFAHRHTGLQIGTIRVGVGKLTTNWIWEK